MQSFFTRLLGKLKGIFTSGRKEKGKAKTVRRFESILEDHVYANIETYQTQEYREIFEMWRQKEYRPAMERCTERLKEKPEDKILYILRSNCYRLLSNRVKQDQDLTTALGLDPDNIWLLRARLCGIATKKRCLRHIEDITRLLELDPENYDEYLVHRAYYYHWSGNDAAARQDLLTVEEHQAEYAMSTADFRYLYAQMIAGQEPKSNSEDMGQEWWRQ
ncbi:MAG: hypothetical protein HFI33_06610 [Lachnospiraceae bacterium]|nr:hypothetical protein [Lachnospiraceae bacterium]